jgi:hypothetical protein
LSLEMWQGAEQEYAAGRRPIRLFEALSGKGVYVFKQADSVPRAFLANGGLCYVHSNLLEVCTPECRNPLELVAYDKACDAYARLASWAHEEQTGERVHVYKTNIAYDPKGEQPYTTVGSHENYLVERRAYLENLHLLVPYLVLRQILFGAGGFVDGEYWVSPRTIFPKAVYSETSTDYPIVSTRDEPHADEEHFRVHIVNGEGLRSEYTSLLKFSFTSHVLLAIQEGHIKDVPEIADPIPQGQEIARNLNGDWVVRLAEGGRMGVVDYLNAHYLDGVERLFSERETSEADRLALKELKWALGRLDQGLLEDLDTSLEWRIKLRLVEGGFGGLQVEEGLDEVSAREAAAFQYTAVTDPLYDVLVEDSGVKTVIPEGEVERAFMEPPPGSRGLFRVQAAESLKESLHSVSWSSLKLKKGYRVLQYEFPELDGWDTQKIESSIREARTLVMHK